MMLPAVLAMAAVGGTAVGVPAALDDAHQRDGHALRWREC